MKMETKYSVHIHRNWGRPYITIRHYAGSYVYNLFFDITGRLHRNYTPYHVRVKYAELDGGVLDLTETKKIIRMSRKIRRQPERS